MTVQLKPAQAVALLAFFGVFIGSFLPWVSVGIFTKNGTDGDGIITLILAATGVALLLFARSQGPALLAGLAALLAVGVGGYDAVNISNKANELNSTQSLIQFNVSIGSGLVLLIISGIAATVACLMFANGLSGVGPASVRSAGHATCSECGAELDLSATSCPSCGVEFTAPPERRYQRIR